MKLIDLSHTIHPALAVYPGDDPVQLEQIRTLEQDGFVDFRFTTGMHVGTHIDGPMHMTSDNRLMSQLPLERFAGKGVLVDVRGEQMIEYREYFRTLFGADDIVLFYSGLDALFGTPQYFTAFPCITDELARFLADQQVKMVGIDWASPDHYPYSVHTILLENKIFIIENLINLSQLLHETNFEIFAFPLKIEADSSAVRVVARVME